jgi:methyl-accepting chemotaxis protein
MTIVRRLFLLIAAAILGLIAVGITGMTQMSEIYANLVFANKESIPRLTKVEAIDSGFMKFRIAYLTVNFVVPEAQKPVAQKQLDQARADFDAKLADYEKVATDAKDREYLETTKRLFGEYLGLLQRSQEFMAANQLEEARKLSAPAREIGGRLSANIADHVKHNVERAADEERKGAAAYRTGTIIAAIIVVAAAVGVAFWGFFTYRHVAASLRGMEDAMEAVATNFDLTYRAKILAEDELGRTAKSFNRLIGVIHDSMKEILAKAHAVDASVNDVASTAKHISEVSAQQSESAASMAANMQQLTVSISHIAERSADANRLVTESGESARAGADTIGRTVADIHGVADTVHAATGHFEQFEQQSSRITSVVSVIKEVADQTNLLALNAAIEAARAGEQGRGFAVVADEVRKLAERTTQSTQEIATTISEMQATSRLAADGMHQVDSRVETSVAQAKEATTSITAIEQSSQSVISMVNEIGDAIREQGVASTAIAQQVEHIAQIAEENSAVSKSTAATADNLAHLASDMRAVVSRFKV